MTTSANVTMFDIKRHGEVVGTHSFNHLCKPRWEKLLRFTPLDEHTITPYGYDEDEAPWRGTSEKLSVFLTKEGVIKSQTISEKSLGCLDASAKNFSEGKASEPIKIPPSFSQEPQIMSITIKEIRDFCDDVCCFPIDGRVNLAVKYIRWLDEERTRLIKECEILKYERNHSKVRAATFTDAVGTSGGKVSISANKDLPSPK